MQAELHEKQLKYIAGSKDIHKHMIEQIKTSEQRKKEQEKIDQELLKQRIAQDEKVRSSGNSQKLQYNNCSFATNNWKGKEYCKKKPQDSSNFICHKWKR